MHLSKIIAPLSLVLVLAACDSPEEKAADHYDRGLEFIEAGDLVSARLELRNALRELGSHMEARLALARMNLDEGALRPAFRDYTRVVEQDPSNLEAQVALGRIAFLTQNWNAFDRHSDAAITLASDSAEAKELDIARRYRQAVLDEDMGQRSALVAEAEAMTAELPDSEILRQILIDGYMFEQRYEEALLQIDKAIAADPEDKSLYSFRLRILANLQDDDRIETELYRLTETFPDDTSYTNGLLQFLIARGKEDSAEEFLRARVAAADPENVENDIVNVVQFLLNVRGRDAAMAELDAAIEASPQAFTLRALQASLVFDDGRRDEGISGMENLIAETEALEESPIEPEQMHNIKMTLATMLNETGNKVGARGIVEQILSENAEFVRALKMQARWMIEEDNTEGAINSMRTALSISEQDSEAMTIMAAAYQRSGNKALMLDFLALAVEASDNAPEESLRYAAALREDDKALQAESILVSALRRQPQSIQLLEALGGVYLELQDFARGQQVVDALRRLGTQQANNSASGIELEIVAAQSGSDTALAMLEDLAQDAGGNTGVNLALVRARLQSGDSAGALELADELVAADPENNTLVYFRALALAANRDYEAAIAELNTVIERAPGIVPAWLQLARLQGALGQRDDVVATIDAALDANPEAPDLLWAKASYLQQQGDIDGTIAIYEQLYEQNSASIVIANNLASLLATFRRDEESLERARVISRRLQDTDIPAFQDTYGWIQHRLGNSEDALAYLEPAAAALSDDPTVQYHLGAAYKALNRTEEALTQMRRAIEILGPIGSTDLAEEIRGAIRSLENPADQ